MCVCPALILSFPVMSLLSEGLGRSTTASTHRVEAGIFVNWEAHCAGPGTNSEYPVQSGDQPPYPLGIIRTIRTETIGQGQIISSNLEALYAHAKRLENYTKALNPTLHGRSRQLGRATREGPPRAWICADVTGQLVEVVAPRCL